MLALGFLSKAYQVADTVQRKSFETAAEPLLAINNSFNPLYESVFAVSILILSLTMLKGVFDRKVAYLGVLTSISAFIALLLFPIVGIGYFWWWLLFMVWFIAVGFKLYNMGRS
jgi:fatty acid desaturase